MSLAEQGTVACSSVSELFNYQPVEPEGGFELAISGDIAVVLELTEDDNWVSQHYHRQNGIWELEATRPAPYASSLIYAPFKRADISGDLTIVRPDYMSPGGFAIYNRDGGNWTLEASSDDGSGGEYGLSASISGDVAALGNTLQSDGQAIIYRRSSKGVWSQEAIVSPPSEDAVFFGVDVAVDGDNLLVATLAGGVYAYQFDGANWTYQQHLTHPLVKALGTSVDLDGNVAVVGSYYDKSPAGTEGAVVFRLSDGNWSIEQQLDTADANIIDLGYSVRVDGDMVVATAGVNFGDSLVPGTAHVYQFDGTQWNEIAQIETSDPDLVPGFLTSPIVGLSGTQVASGFYWGGAVEFKEIAMNTFLPPGDPIGLDCNDNDLCDDLDIASGNSDDCNGNQIPDECDLADGTLLDVNLDGIPDACQCLGDLNGDETIGVDDVLILLTEYGTDCSAGCVSDLDGSGEVNVDDLLSLLQVYDTPCSQP
ncbi:MAG: hypothetical protein CMJ39_10465 [Phycisphaerae bacterium]|nr:hypothetical protein [Phycisphaerae bacterium]